MGVCVSGPDCGSLALVGRTVFQEMVHRRGACVCGTDTLLFSGPGLALFAGDGSPWFTIIGLVPWGVYLLGALVYLIFTVSTTARYTSSVKFSLEAEST